MTERTPAGGDRSEVTFLAPDGRILPDATGATTAIIREYANDILIKTTHMDAPGNTTPTWTPPGDALAEPAVYDTTKATWNVWDQDDGIYRLANTTASLLHAVGHADSPQPEQRAFLLNLMTLPSWHNAPLELKQDVTHWLVSH